MASGLFSWPRPLGGAATETAANAHAGQPPSRTLRGASAVAAGILLAASAAVSACGAQERPGSGSDAGTGRPAGMVADLGSTGSPVPGLEALEFPNRSALGSYLAGRVARAERDTKAAALFYGRALEADPDNPMLARRTFILLLADGRFDEARALAPALEASGEEASVVALLYSVDALRAGDPAGAIAAIDEAPVAGFVTLLAPLIKAWAEIGRDAPDAALAQLDALNDTPGLSLFGDFHRAMVLDAAGRDTDADAAYRKVISSGRNAAIRSEIAYGRFLENRGRTEEAESLYAQEGGLLEAERQAGLERLAAGITAEPLVSAPSQGVAEALLGAATVISRDDPGEAVDMYIRLALLARPDMPAAQMLLGDLLESRGQYERAVAAYQAVPSGSAYHREARLRAAWSLNRLKRSGEAQAILREMAAEDPTTVEPLVTLGDLLREEEKFNDAARVYSSAVDRLGAPMARHWPLYYSRGIAYERAKDWDAAERDFLKALELQPEQPFVLNYLGYSWVDRGVRLNEARDMIARAVKARPDDGYIVDSLGWALYRLGDFEGSVHQLERAVELSPSDPTINDHLGDAYWQVGRKAEARFQWQRAMSLDPPPEIVEGLGDKLKNGMAPATPPARRAAEGR
ncbi:MAG: tetratricopeptide repeat protein [Sneathiellaceae bacterium]